MKKKYHFISGLPRSGSTLLVSILNQNPKFYAEISNPLCDYITKLVEVNGSDVSNKVICPNSRMRNTVLGMIEGYYSEHNKETFFNCGRGWTRITEYLNEINSNFKIICTVRDYVSILNSFETLYKKRGFTDGRLVYGDQTLNVYSRTNFLANESFVRFAYNALREAYYGPHSKNLLIVEYLDLVDEPQDTMERIYDFIKEPYFDHDFENVSYSFDEYDLALGSRNLHKVRSKVQIQNNPTILPPDLCESYKNWEFWR